MYYTNTLPKIDSIVFVTIKEFSKHGTYCNLIEYDEIEGFILNTELDRRVYDPKKQFNMGKIYPMLVMSVDIKTNKIDLSYKKVNILDRPQLVNKFYDISRIIKLCDEYSFITGLSKTEVYKNTVHKFFEDNNQLDISSELYTKFLSNPDHFVEFIIELYPDETDKFIKNIKSRITYGNMEMTKMFKLKMYDTDSIKKLINILSCCENISGEKKIHNTEIIYGGSPRYLIKTYGLTKEICLQNIKLCIKYLENEKIKYNCHLEIYPDADELSEFGCKIIRPQEVTIKPLNME